MALTNATASIGVTANIPYTGFGTLAIKEASQFSYSSGTTPPNKADICYITSRTIVSGTDLSLDLSGTSLVQPDGSTANFVKLGLIYVINTMTTGTATLTVGGGTGAVVSAFPPLGPGDVLCFASNGTGLTVTNTSADVLKLSSSSGSITCKIILIGRSA